MGKEDTNYVLREVHEGIYGNHIGARSLAAKTLRQGYYWPTILIDATELVKKCKIYQEHAQIPHLLFRAADLNDKPLALPIVGARLIGTPTHWEGPMQVYRGRSGLRHQVG